MNDHHQIAAERNAQIDRANVSEKLAMAIAYARQNSPFYANSWHSLPDNELTLSDLPLVDLPKYWAKNRDLDNWDVLTEKITDAIAFKTGGTTGTEKVSLYTRREWKKITSIFGHCISEKFKKGDRVANLFMSGDLYASFLFVNGSLMESRTPIFEFPFTGTVDNEKLINHINNYDINVLIIVPARLMQLNAYLVERKSSLPQINTILYGGECIFPEQRLTIKRGFPNASCSSIGCVSVDASLIGASTSDCEGNEHRCFDDDTVVEIIDEGEGKPILEPGQVGKLVVTNFHRKLMPIIRYPTGDLAKWIEPEGCAMRKFLLCGRSGFNYRLRIGNVAIFPNRLHDSICELISDPSWQIVIKHQYLADIITVRIVGNLRSGAVEQLYSSIMKHDDRIPGQISEGLLQVHIESCGFNDLVMHPRSGKLMQIVDQRTY